MPIYEYRCENGHLFEVMQKITEDPVTPFHVQRQTLPVVFVPGFLGTDINCGARQLWPNAPFPDPLAMRLAADGLTNFGCTGAAPGDVVDTVLFKDIYDTVGDYVRDELEPGRGTMFG